MVMLLNMEEWVVPEEENSDSEKKKEPECKCGRAVCCGKHKNGQCSCQKKEKERS